MIIEMPMSPEKEVERLQALSELNIDFSQARTEYDGLAELAAKIAGTNIGLINLIDSYTQWTISHHGLEIEQMMREDSVCHYTIMNGEQFEVGDLSLDDRFKDKFYVTGEPLAKYYLGVPLSTGNGVNIGALCVMDQEEKKLQPEQVALLKIVAEEIVGKLKTDRILEDFRNRIVDSERSKRKVAHDIRGPLAGIIGLSEIIESQGSDNDIDEVLEFVKLIRESGSSLIELTSEILGASNGGETVGTTAYTLNVLRDKLLKLYAPQARQKEISLQVNVGTGSEQITGLGGKLLQITGNLICNALKFSQAGSGVEVMIALASQNSGKVLSIEVKDFGKGMNTAEVQAIVDGHPYTMPGTMGESGFGFGLAFVKQLIEQESGSLQIVSSPGEGTTFIVNFPV